MLLLRNPGAAGLVLAAQVAAMTEPAMAQSLLQQLFGFGAQSRQSAERRLLPPSTLYRDAPLRSRSWSGFSDEDADASSHQSLGGGLRAVCVRTCDGYYWPIEESVTYSGLDAAARRCKASCSTEARLFYHEKSDTDVAAMIDLAGQRYDSLSHAFLYREKLMEGCTCKPAPWTAASRLRHAEYLVTMLRAQAEQEAREAEAREAEARRLAAIKAAAPPAPAASPQRRTLASDAVPVVGEPDRDRVEASSGDTKVEPEVVVAPDAPPEPPHAAISEAAPPNVRVFRVPSSEVPRRNRAGRPIRARVASGAGKSPSLGLFGFSQKKYVWPGDGR